MASQPLPDNAAGQKNSAAIVRVLRTIARQPAGVIFYGAAALAVASIFPGAQIPPELAPLAPLIAAGVGLGINTLADILGRVARGEDVREVEMRTALENAVTLSSSMLDGLLKDDTFQRALARQMHELHVMKTLLRDNELEILEQLSQQSALFGAYAQDMRADFVEVKATLRTLSTSAQVDALSGKLDQVLAMVAHNAGPVQALHQLPSPPADFTGRKAELRELRAAIAAAGSGGAIIAGLRGLGGVGKTALALVLAYELRADYPDAQFLVDLRGLDGQPTTVRAAMEQVVRGFLGAQAPMPDDEAQIAPLYRSCLSGQKALLLLDNAREAAQVRPLLPPAGCLAIVTSRQRFKLDGLYAQNIEQMPATRCCFC